AKPGMDQHLAHVPAAPVGPRACHVTSAPFGGLDTGRSRCYPDARRRGERGSASPAARSRQGGLVPAGAGCDLCKVVE
ncbi:MAG: hypothetical protein KAX80_12620, partial [Planctomycetes bacterium]|nr:hypothetical protein [Planctomycetota bacterium]